MAAVVPSAEPALAGVRATKPGRACERTLVRKVAISDPARPDTLTVRATGPSCAQALIAVTLRSAAGRRLWSEQAFLGAVESARLPGEAPAGEVSFEQVIAAVEGWVSLEATQDAPAWPRGAGSLPAGPGPGPTQYETRLDHGAYERIRAAREPMLCIPVGPEAAHCVARDPASGKLVAFLGRGD